VVTGILLALNLPPTSPWWLTLLGAVIAIAIGKQVYGGLGANPFNPALVARVALLISFPVQMTTWSAPAPLGSGQDLVTSATPLGEWKSAVLLTGTLPVAPQGSTLDYLLGSMPGCIGEVSALAIALGALYLFWRKILNLAHPAVSYLGSVVLLSGLLAGRPGALPRPGVPSADRRADLGPSTMATDMVTSPVTPRGWCCSGSAAGC